MNEKDERQEEEDPLKYRPNPDMLVSKSTQAAQVNCILFFSFQMLSFDSFCGGMVCCLNSNAQIWSILFPDVPAGVNFLAVILQFIATVAPSFVSSPCDG